MNKINDQNSTLFEFLNQNVSSMTSEKGLFKNDKRHITSHYCNIFLYVSYHAYICALKYDKRNPKNMRPCVVFIAHYNPVLYTPEL